MTGVNETNAVVREQARIREAVVKIKGKNLSIELESTGLAKGEIPTSITCNGGNFIRVSDVLAILKPPTV